MVQNNNGPQIRPPGHPEKDFPVELIRKMRKIRREAMDILYGQEKKDKRKSIQRNR